MNCTRSVIGSQPFFVNKFSDMMEDVSEATGLSKIYSNHCIKAISIALWSNGDLINRYTISISRYRNEPSLQRHYT